MTRRLALLLAALAAPFLAPAIAHAEAENTAAVARVRAGQGAEAFARWRGAAPGRAQAVAAFEAYLGRARAADALPLHQVLRTDERWGKCGEPFHLPPRTEWPRIAPTLRLIRDEVRPRIGPVEVVSGFRPPALNACVGGASRSAHLKFGALDLRPVNRAARATAPARLCALWRQKGRRLRLGLGIYSIARFHVDTAGWRTWGPDYHRGSSPCVG